MSSMLILATSGLSKVCPQYEFCATSCNAKANYIRRFISRGTKVHIEDKNLNNGKFQSSRAKSFCVNRLKWADA